MEESKLVNGMRVFKSHPNAPEFVKANISIDCKELVEFMRANHKDGKIRVDILESKKGGLYAKLNSFEPKKEPTHPFGQGKTYQEAILHAPLLVDDFYDTIPENEINLQNIPF